MKTNGYAQTLAQPKLRITEGEKATLTIGDRVPIPTTTFNTGNMNNFAIDSGTFVAVGVPFKHLIVVAQTARFDVDRAVEILHRTGYADVQREAVAGRIEYARRWLESFAPEELKFEVQESVPQQASELSDEQRAFLRRLAGQLDASMDGAAIHALVYELAGEFSESKPAQLFQAIYVSLLGKERGPRAGAFLSVLGTDFAVRRFSEVAGRES